MDSEVSGRKSAEQGKSSRDAFCVPCDREGECEPATGYCQDCQEHLCDVCYRSHKRSKASKNHVILDASKMPRTTHPVPSKRSDCNVPCPKHNDKVLEFFCRDHKDVVCYVCSTLEHSSCKKEYIPDMSGTYVQGPAYLSKLKNMERLLKRCNDLRIRAVDCTKEIGKSYAETNDKIDQFRKEINGILDQWQNEIKKEADKIRKTSLEKLTPISETLSSLETKITDMQSRIDQLNKSGNTNKLFIELKQVQAQLDNYESAIKQQETASVVSGFEFTENVPLRDLLQKQNSIGELTKYNTVFKQMREQNCIGELTNTEYFKQNKATFMKEINVKIKEDKSTCRITGMAMLSVNNIATSDFNNNTVKLVNTTTNTVTSRLRLSSQPWDIALLPDDQIAVTMGTQGIQILSTKPSLSVVRTLAVDGCSRGIAYGLGALVVTFVDPGKFQILSLQGDVLFTSSPNLGISDFPLYVDISKDEQYILVSDDVINRVILIDWEGNMLRQYADTELTDARAVLSCDDGSFLVCTRDKHMVYRVSADCTKVVGLIKKEDGIEYPYALCYNGNDTLCVSCVSANKNVANFIKVFSI